MAYIWEKAISILAGNLNSGRSYLITAVTGQVPLPNLPGWLKILHLNRWIMWELMSPFIFVTYFLVEFMKDDLDTWLISDPANFKGERKDQFGRTRSILLSQNSRILVAKYPASKLVSTLVRFWKYCPEIERGIHPLPKNCAKANKAVFM